MNSLVFLAVFLVADCARAFRHFSSGSTEELSSPVSYEEPDSLQSRSSSEEQRFRTAAFLRQPSIALDKTTARFHRTVGAGGDFPGENSAAAILGRALFFDQPPRYPGSTCLAKFDYSRGRRLVPCDCSRPVKQPHCDCSYVRKQLPCDYPYGRKQLPSASPSQRLRRLPSQPFGLDYGTRWASGVSSAPYGYNPYTPSSWNLLYGEPLSPAPVQYARPNSFSYPLSAFFGSSGTPLLF